MSLDPANGDWNSDLEFAFPDCRLKPIERHENRRRLGRMEMDIFFCANCFKECGLVGPGCPFMFFLCDDCARTPPPGLVRVG